MRWFWLDRFTEFVSGTRATAVKGVALSEEHLHDHWPYYPVMPNTLIAEGMAQAGGLLVSEIYRFSELVVLAKFSKMRVPRPACGRATSSPIARNRPGEGRRRFGHGDRPRRRSSASRSGDFLCPARPPTRPNLPKGTRLFDPIHLLHWLKLVGVFEVGTRPDGTRLRSKTTTIQQCHEDTESRGKQRCDCGDRE